MRIFLMLAALGIGFTVTHPAWAGDASRKVTLYKDPQCECCEGYARHLQTNGYTVTVVPTGELDAMNQKAGIPDELQGCHLAFVDGYTVSGHVPVAAVDRMLSERPDIKGITLPGMPSGSPGMGGLKSEPFTIYEIGASEPTVYAVE
ncbi:MAG: DUF411 domain-containing protein [Proteobacteria bacterium]|nr:DUF411 domain-containing protein [Pseudomonadota bacterium]